MACGDLIVLDPPMERSRGSNNRKSRSMVPD